MATKPIFAVSNKPVLTIHVKPEEPILDAKGVLVGQSRRLTVQFIRGAVPDWALRQVEDFTPTGQPMDFPREMMLGWFSSAEEAQRLNWTDDEHEFVVRKLTEDANPYFRIVEVPRVDAPFPKIEDFRPRGSRTPAVAAEKLLAVCENAGIDLRDVELYLRQEGWDQRVIDAVHAALVASEAEAEQDEELVDA